MIEYAYDDGGRAAAGFKGSAGDCGVRAMAIAAGIPYREAYDRCNRAAKQERPSRGRTKSSARTGMHRDTFAEALRELGFRWVPTMTVGAGCTVHLRSDELPAGRIIARVSKHYTAVIDGVIRDTFDPSRDGDRCVYGYFIRPER